MTNPYADALDGLTLDDPVRAFFDFCREREAVRARREGGQAAPWSQDPIFQKARFLNVFREDDRGSKAIRRFVEPVADDPPRLIHALFFARWCNEPSVLDSLTVDLLERPDDLNAALMRHSPWFNATAYPVGPATIDGQRRSRRDVATHGLREVLPRLVDSIQTADRDVVRATRAANAILNLDNDFPVFMAVVDVASFRPDLIDPASPVPTGIGAAPFLDRLQAHLGLDSHADTCRAMIALQPERWPEARRALQPIDVEYLSCECRKYWSYAHGTKTFTGKNVFRPGHTPLVEVDVDADAAPVQTHIHVLAGGPCSGKSTVANLLEQQGFLVIPETSRELLEAADEDPRLDPAAWQTRILHADHALFSGLPKDRVVITDTSFVENLVFARDAGLEVGPRLRRWLERCRYAKVFFLEPLERYEQDAVRSQTQATARRLGDRIREQYKALGYDLIPVPRGTPQDRAAFVQARIEG